MDNFEAQTSTPTSTASPIDQSNMLGVEKEPLQNVGGIQSEIKEGQFDLMDVPGTAHDKLISLADTNSEIKKQMETDEEELEEIPIEQQIMRFQNHVMELLLEKMHEEKKNNSDAEKMLKKLKELIEKLKNENEQEQSSLMGVILTLTLAIFSMIQMSTTEEKAKN